MDATVELTPRQETLLVFLRAGGGERVDPIRIQKALFILAKETPKDWLPTEARYRFEPYNYGPYSTDIYYDLERLERDGYVETSELPGRSWKYYSLSPEGNEAAHALVETADSRVTKY